jgi:endonuclease/exonuclease/phosphatase family metal-dependent hydrolase
MKRAIKLVLKLVALVILLVLLYVAGVLLYGTVRDFKPEALTALTPDQNASNSIIQDSILTFTIWNIGYGGLGAEANFFFDSGNMFFSGDRMVRSSRGNVEKYIDGIEAFVMSNPADFMLFQEVDFNSKRSYYNNQFEGISDLLSGYSAVFAVNYQVDWVPLPIFQPWKAYGATNSGLASWSRYQPQSSVRMQLPGSFDWPTSIFQLDRCAAIQRFKVKEGKELVVINVHNSAYDRDGSLKAAQMAFLQKVFLEEYEKGNYVVVGGDWNQCPPGFQFDKFMPGNTSGYTQTNIDHGFVPSDWTWCFDFNTPTNRKLRDTYQPGETFITLIDFFLISPNIQLLKTQTHDLDFKYADHQPVTMKIKIR